MLNFIEQWGSGLVRIKNLCVENKLTIPEIKESGYFPQFVFKRPDTDKTPISDIVTDYQYRHNYHTDFTYTYNPDEYGAEIFN